MKIAFEYVYSGEATLPDGTVRLFEGNASCPGRLTGERLSAIALRDIARTQDVPLGELELSGFRFSEFEAEPDTGHHPHPSTRSANPPD